MLDDDLGLYGVMKLWERPEHLDAAAFMSVDPEELGESIVTAKNIVVNNWYVDAFQLMAGSVSGNSIQETVLSVGTGALGGGATRTDVTLVTEWRRYQLVSSIVNSADPPSITCSFFLPAADGAVTLTEAGLFHGGATIVSGSGRMSSHVAFSYSKSAGTDLRIDYTLTRSLT